MIRTPSFPAAALLFLCAACGGGDPRAAASNDTTPPRPAVHAEDGAEVHGASADTTFTLRFDGMGPLRVGMTVAEARRALGHFSRVHRAPADSMACGYGTSVRLPPGVRVMLENARVVRVQVDSATGVATAEGARIGDTEARIQRLYPGRVAVEPHKYTDGHDLVVRPAAAADTTHRMIFETDGRAVLRFRAGQRPQVGYVEGCS